MVKRFHSHHTDLGVRLDQFLQNHSTNLSRTKIRKIIELGGVHVDGKRVRKCGFSIKDGQKIELYQDGGSLEPFRIKTEHILFQDDYIIVLNKTAGIETQPTPSRYKGTLYEALLHHLKRDNRSRKAEIGMIQRLDRDTSGVIVFSIHRQAHKNLTEQIKNHTLDKEYLALVKGIPIQEEGHFHTFLEHDKNARRMRSVRNGGKEAITHYEVKTKWPESALVSVQLVTGRTHQIRAHFAENGHPLLGDTRYGGPAFHEGAKWNRQCLHAWKLRLRHPIENSELQFVAPVPPDMVLAGQF